MENATINKITLDGASHLGMKLARFDFNESVKNLSYPGCSLKPIKTLPTLKARKVLINLEQDKVNSEDEFIELAVKVCGAYLESWICFYENRMLID